MATATAASADRVSNTSCVTASPAADERLSHPSLSINDPSSLKGRNTPASPQVDKISRLEDDAVEISSVIADTTPLLSDGRATLFTAPNPPIVDRVVEEDGREGKSSSAVGGVAEVDDGKISSSVKLASELSCSSDGDQLDREVEESPSLH